MYDRMSSHGLLGVCAHERAGAGLYNILSYIIVPHSMVLYFMPGRHYHMFIPGRKEGKEGGKKERKEGAARLYQHCNHACKAEVLIPRTSRMASYISYLPYQPQ